MDELDYEKSVNRFAEELTRNHPDVCFYVYGSFKRGDFQKDFNRYHPRRNSDVDGGLIFETGVVIPKQEVREISKLFLYAWDQRIEAQLNLLDTITGEDGRFLSYTQDYTDYIVREASVLSGPNYLPQLNGLRKKTGNLYAASFNFRRNRNNLILAAIDSRSLDESEFVKRTQDAIERAVKLPKKLIWLRRQGDIVIGIREARRELEEILPRCDFSTLDRLISLRDVPRGENPLRNLAYCRDLQEMAVESMEEMIRAYIESFPEHSKTEVS